MKSSMPPMYFKSNVEIDSYNNGSITVLNEELIVSNLEGILIDFASIGEGKPSIFKKLYPKDPKHMASCYSDYDFY